MSMNHTKLKPAYGRRYLMVESAIKAFRNGSDWIAMRPGDPYCSVRDFKRGETALLMYGRNNDKFTKVIV